MKNKSDLYKFDTLLGTQPDAQIAKLAKVSQGAGNKRRRSKPPSTSECDGGYR